MGIRGAVALLVLAASAACMPATAATALKPGVGPQAASTLAVQIVQLMGQGRYELAWNHLYPQHQAIVSRARYVTCESLSPLPIVTRVKVLSAEPDLISVPGLDRPVVGYTVTLRTTFQDMRFGTYDVHHVVHVLAVHGHAVWILSAHRFDAYSHNLCP